MTTIITIEQGGTGVQTVQELKEVLELKQSAFLNKSDNIDDDSHELLSTAYVVNQLAKKIEAGLDPSNIVPIEKGGTGADNAIDAVKNLGIQNTTIVYPISIENGGTGAVSSELAIRNLGLDIPVPIEKGGTGAATALDSIRNLGLDIPIPIEKGGTGSDNAPDAIRNLGLDIPIPIEKGGTGSDNALDAIRNLGLDIPVPIEKGGTGAATALDSIRNLGLDIPIPIEKGGTGTDNALDAIKRLGLDIPVPVNKGGTGTNNALDAIRNLGLDIPIPIEKGGTGAISLLSIIENLKLDNFAINQISDNDDLNKKNFAGLYIYETDNIITNPINMPDDISPDTKRFILLVLSSISKLPGNLADSINSENNNGIGIQLFFTIDDDNKKKDMNEIYIRTLKRGVTDIGTTKKVWSVWTRINSNKTTTISAGSPSGGKNGDIWIQYIS